MSGSAVSQILRVGESSVSRAVGRGEKLAHDMKLMLLES